METIDPRLLIEYQRMATSGLQFWGLSILEHKEQIGKIIRATDSETILDYGSGAGHAYRKPHFIQVAWGVPVPKKYDPAFPQFAAKPVGPFDGVLCCDVLEHVGDDYVDAVIDELFGYATKFVFASICCRAAKKTFPSGENLHCSVHPIEWWVQRFDALATCEFFLVETK